MTELPKVLVAAPTYSGKHYIFPKWYENITHLSYKNYDWLVIDNSKRESYSVGLRRQGYKKIVHIKRGKHARQALANSAEYIRQYALKYGYDYVMMIETDLLPPKDIIERLMAHDKKIVGAAYEIGLHGSKEAPRRMCIYDYGNDSDKYERLIRLMSVKEGYEFIDGTLKACAGMGIGCTLMRRDLLEEYPFKYTDKHFLQSDVILYLDLAQNHVPVYVDTGIIVPHFNQNWTVVEDR